jgi:hypothetical protein
VAVWLVDGDKEADLKDARKQGEAEAKAKHQIELDRLHKQFKEYLKPYKDQEVHILVLLAVGFAAAGCDGPISEEEYRVLMDCALGMSEQRIRFELRTSIERMRVSPPTFADAMKILDSLHDDSIYPHVDRIIKLALAIDDRQAYQKELFRAAWQRHRSLSAAHHPTGSFWSKPVVGNVTMLQTQNYSPLARKA